MSSVRYGTRLGDLKNKQPTESTIAITIIFQKITVKVEFNEYKASKRKLVVCLRGTVWG